MTRLFGLFGGVALTGEVEVKKKAEGLEMQKQTEWKGRHDAVSVCLGFHVLCSSANDRRPECCAITRKHCWTSHIEDPSTGLPRRALGLAGDAALRALPPDGLPTATSPPALLNDQTASPFRVARMYAQSGHASLPLALWYSVIRSIHAQKLSVVMPFSDPSHT